MNRAEYSKLIYSGKYSLPLDTATKKSYKILVYRSTVISGKIEEVELPELPENFFIISAKDLKGRNSLKINGEKIPVLADKKVNYIGEPILLLLGSSISTLKSLHKKIQIKYSDPIVEESEVFFSKKIEIGSVEEAFREPYKNISGTIKTPKSIINSKYIHGSFTKREGDTYLIYSTSIWESLLRDNIASLCNIDVDKVKVVSAGVTGESEYPLLDCFMASAFTTLSSAKIKKNVTYFPTPEDQYQYSSKHYGIKADWQIAFDTENSVLGIKIDVVLDCGAYPVFVKEKVLRIVHGLTSYYKYRNILINVKAIRSNLPPSGLTEGLNLSDALFVSELLMSKIIKECNKDQFAFRNDNLLKKGFKNSTGSIIKKDIPLSKMLENIVRKSDFLRKNSSINLSLLRKDKRIPHKEKRGIGITVGYNGNGFISNDKDMATHSVSVQLNREGKVDLKVGYRINNLELLTIWEELLVEILNVQPGDITIYQEDISLLEDSGPNIQNKNVTILTPLIKQCADDIKVRRFKDPLPIKQVKSTRRKPSNLWNYETWRGEPFKNASLGACAMEVEIDKRSLSCIIKEIWLEIEIGQILNKQCLISSLNREIYNTIKWLQESEPKERSGEFSSHYFYNKSVVNPKPIIHISIFDSGKNKNIPKGVGSLVRNLLPGAYIQGVNQALGANINMFPISKETIYKELSKDEV